MANTVTPYSVTPPAGDSGAFEESLKIGSYLGDIPSVPTGGSSDAFEQTLKAGSYLGDIPSVPTGGSSDAFEQSLKIGSYLGNIPSVPTGGSSGAFEPNPGFHPYLGIGPALPPSSLGASGGPTSAGQFSWAVNYVANNNGIPPGQNWTKAQFLSQAKTAKDPLMQSAYQIIGNSSDADFSSLESAVNGKYDGLAGEWDAQTWAKAHSHI